MKLFLILGNQLFAPKYLNKFKDHIIYMAEDYDLCTFEKHHKQKILLFLSSMRSYGDELKSKNFNLIYKDVNKEFKLSYEKKLEKSAQNKEDSILNLAKKSWDSKFLNIFKSRGLYAIKLSSNDSLNFYRDSIKNEIIIGYTLKEISGRVIYETSYLKPEIYDRSKEGQLLKGFEILVSNFQKGDSIVALIPSNLLFGKNGSFINQIPPFTPMKVNLKIN